ncbi:hypothetical protein C8A00DRAFT_34919 [Chaetomidium leptoderma]|uniref:Uncharacterized protein n=1 Tax=Chaetomidium leptoderma TaxID=669021 RepID=A0AAN6ZXF3_9PEZI|nr:hypothetical protein C8A00DRAFT_34919 [Chaetomidium leptoderma]
MEQHARLSTLSGELEGFPNATIATRAGIIRPSLATIPLELVTEICTYLCSHYHPKTDDAEPDVSARVRSEQAALSSLSQTCKILRIVAQPFLFGHVYASRDSAFYLFVRTLVERPDLRSCVSQVTVATYPCEQPPDTPDSADTHNPPDPPSGGIAKTAEEHLRDGDWEPLWKTLAIGGQASNAAEKKFGAFVSMLLHMAPKLADVSFCVRSVPIVALSYWSTRPTIQSLKRLSFTVSEPSHDEYMLDAAVDILRAAPNLEVLHCHGCAGVSEQFRGSWGRTRIDNPPQLPNLTELILTGCHMRAHDLRNLMGAVGSRLFKVTIRKDKDLPPWP